MHRPPPIHFAVNRSRYLGRALGLMLVLNLLITVAFFWYQPISAESLSIFLAVILLAGGFAMHVWRNAPVGCLQWDGKAWHWSGFGFNVPCEVRLQMDIQSVLIVSLRQAGARKIWLWMDAPAGSPDWLALRRAVVGSQRVVAADAPSDDALLDGEGR